MCSHQKINMSDTNNGIKRPTSAVESKTTKILKRIGYIIGKTIGEGTYSKVCVATVKGLTQEKVACKIIHKKYAGHDFITRFLPRELKLMHVIEHKNIVNVFEVIEINDKIFMFMDYCRNGDLLEYIRNNGPLSEEKAKEYFRQLVNAIEYLHNLNIAHRDIKCENILLSLHNTVKLCDFGFARSCVDDDGEKILSKTFCGSAAYAAPEILQGIPYEPKMYDIWALGCVLYIMLSATMPFDDTNIKKMLRNQINCSLNLDAFCLWRSNADPLKKLITNLLEPKVEKRAVIQEVSNCLWLQTLQNSKYLLQSEYCKF